MACISDTPQLIRRISLRLFNNLIASTFCLLIRLYLFIIYCRTTRGLITGLQWVRIWKNMGRKRSDNYRHYRGIFLRAGIPFPKKIPNQDIRCTAEIRTGKQLARSVTPEPSC
jgi:hypothetical protein